MKKLNLVGKKFSRLTVVSFSHIEKEQSRWNCVCDCGNKITIRGWVLTSGRTKSCGCLRVETTSKQFTTHGLTNDPLYKVWEAMKRRCLSVKEKSYKDYGGRGIKVCDRWLNSFENFHRDMSKGYKWNLTIDRIDVNGNYEPNNCRWATQLQQRSNQRPRKGRS